MFELISVYRKNDPAAKSFLEVLLLYPGVKALFFHRIAHTFFRVRLYFLARLVAEVSRWITLVEIHPGAVVGKCLFIDHGCGIVIGETAVIGDYCAIYHGVTLGGVSIADLKRHPTLENHVMVGAGAKILGAITIGAHSKIGANSVVTKDVAPGATVAGIPAKQISP